MASPTAKRVRNGYLYVNNPDMSDTKRGRSLSITRSHRSSTSCVTEVEDKPNATPYDSSNFDDCYIIRTVEQRYTWLDHLRGVFGLKPSQKRKSIMRDHFVKPQIPEGAERESTNSPSPWVLAVYVLSSRNDTDKHKIAQLAKATLDTANEQGNLVSRSFVNNVLEFSEEHFSKLTDEEKKGGRGVTGHKLIPVGAIYLTWYSSKSVRIFRNMRFLIVDIDDYDLIIGASSAYKHNLLDVPNFMAGSARGGRTAVNNDGSEDKKRVERSNKVFQLETDIGKLKAKKTETTQEITSQKAAAEQATDADAKAQLLAYIQNLETQLETTKAELEKKIMALAIAKKQLEIYDMKHNKKILAPKKDKLLQDLDNQLNALPGYVKPQLIQSEMTQSTGVQSVEEPRGMRTRQRSNQPTSK